ncbi:MAG TPA: DUF5317 domain-containing protein [Micromonosporaceae bacterium]|nr:DUF5317 domain-containing protein [Micromonosporaceae bacterium]
MLTVYICIAVLVAVAVTGGSLRRLAEIRIRRAWLLWTALAVQILIISVIPDATPALLAVLHIASYLAAGACLVINRNLPGIWMVGLGGALNGVVIAVNGGSLPASADALRAAGRPVATGRFANSAVLPDPHLALLGDVFATPPWVPGHSVFSVGDLAIWVGVGVLFWRTCHVSANLGGRHRDLLIGGAVSARPAPRHRVGTTP